MKLGRHFFTFVNIFYLARDVLTSVTNSVVRKVEGWLNHAPKIWIIKNKFILNKQTNTFYKEQQYKVASSNS